MTMRLDLTEVLQEPGRQTDYPVNESPMVDEDIECLTPLEGVITFNNTGGTLILTGEVETTMALACSRCAEYFEYPIALKIDEAFELRHVSNARLAQIPTVIEEDENPDAGKFFDGAVFDLSELVRQAIMVEQPIQPLPPTDAMKDCAPIVCAVLMRFYRNSGRPRKPMRTPCRSIRLLPDWANC